MNAFMAVVVNRSNSRNWGDTAADVVTKQSGNSSRTMAAARSSWAGSTHEKRKQTATASTPSSRRRRAAFRTASSSSGVSTSPAGGVMRSGTVRRWRRRTKGRSCHGISCRME